MSVSVLELQNNGSSCISPKISDQSSEIHSASLHTQITNEQHGNFDLFHFQYDRMWSVNMTGETKCDVDQSTPQSVQTLSVDRPLFRALFRKIEGPKKD